jgi:hypothetical protein
MVQSMTNTAVEAWRVSRVFERALAKAEAGKQTRYRSQFRWIWKKVDESLEASRLHVVSVEGQPFDPRMVATPLNICEFDSQTSRARWRSGRLDVRVAVEIRLSDLLGLPKPHLTAVRVASQLAASGQEMN